MVRSPRFTPQSFAIFLSFAMAATAHASNTNIVLYASKATVRAGTWAVKADSSAAGGYTIENPNLGAAKLSAPLASPKNYFEIKFPAYAGQPYHLWIRSKSLNNSVTNDSVYVQFSDSVTDTGASIDRIGTGAAEAVVLQACTGAVEAGWGWVGNGRGGVGGGVLLLNT